MPRYEYIKFINNDYELPTSRALNINQVSQETGKTVNALHIHFQNHDTLYCEDYGYYRIDNSKPLTMNKKTMLHTLLKVTKHIPIDSPLYDQFDLVINQLEEGL